MKNREYFVFYQTISLPQTTLLIKLQNFGGNYSFDPLSLYGNSGPNRGTRIVVTGQESTLNMMCLLL